MESEIRRYGLDHKAKGPVRADGGLDATGITQIIDGVLLGEV